MEYDLVALVVTSTVTAASAIVAMTKTPKDNTALAKVYRVVEILAFVFNRAKEQYEKENEKNEDR